MGVVEDLEPENYREFEVEKETKHELEKKLKIALKALNEIRNEAETATWNVNARWLIGTVNGAFYDMERI